MSPIFTAAFQSRIGLLAGALSLAGFAPYITAVLRQGARPNRATWWIWTVAGAIIFASYYSSGGGPSSWVAASYVLGPLAVALLSIWRGEGGFSRLDSACLGATGLSLAAWTFTKNPLLSLSMNIVVDAAGALPTIKKTWLAPRSESLSAWLLFLLADVLNLFAVPDWRNWNVAYPLYLTTLALVISALCLRRGKPFSGKSL